MKTTVILIRHALSENNELKYSHLMRGVSFFSDASITNTGKQQIDALSVYLQGVSHEWGSAIVYSSPVKRALQTSIELCSNMGIPLENVSEAKELSEIDYSTWSGKNKKDVYIDRNLEIIRRFSPLFRTPGSLINLDEMYKGKVVDATLYSSGGESLADVAVRSNRFLRKLLNGDLPPIVLFVSHKWPLSTIITYQGIFNAVDDTSVAVDELQKGKSIAEIKDRYRLSLELALVSRRLNIPNCGSYVLEWDSKKQSLEMLLMSGYMSPKLLTY